MAPSATRESYEFSITVRPGEATGMERYDERFMTFIEEQCTHYAVGIEQKGDKSTEHFQCACIFKVPKRADNLTKTLLALLGPDWSTMQKIKAIKCNKNNDNNDLRILAGGYCQKQDSAPRLKGWTHDEIDPFIKQYEVLKAKSDLRYIPAEKIVGVLKGFHDIFYHHEDSIVRDNFNYKSKPERVRFVMMYAITKGAVLQKYSATNWMNYFNTHYDVLFGGTTSSGLLSQLYSPRII